MCIENKFIDFTFSYLSQNYNSNTTSICLLYTCCKRILFAFCLSSFSATPDLENDTMITDKISNATWELNTIQLVVQGLMSMYHNNYQFSTNQCEDK